MSTAPKTKTPEQLMERRSRVSELYLQCHSMAKIGEMVGVSAQTVYKDICWAREQWRTRAADAIDKHKQLELSRVDHVELEAWKAWERSIGLHEIVTTKTTKVSASAENVKVDLPAEEQTIKAEPLAGDSHFLEIVNKCIESRRKILGLDAPIKGEFAGAGGGPLTLVIEGCEGAAWLPKPAAGKKSANRQG